MTPNNTGIDSDLELILFQFLEDTNNGIILPDEQEAVITAKARITAHLNKAVADARKCQGCGISNSYCGNCERLLQT